MSARLPQTVRATRDKDTARADHDDGGKINLIEVLEQPREPATTVRPDPVHWRREYFIPLAHGELRQKLADDPRLSADEKRQFIQFCKILSATFHYEYQERVEQLKSEYEPFDPDASHSSPPARLDTQERDRYVGTLFEKLTDLLRRANYHKLSQSQIEDAVAAASEWGVRLKVDFKVFDRLEVYARGDLVGRRTRNRWQNFFRAEEIDVPIYQRLLVIFQLRRAARVEKHLDADAVYIKLFKNIPKEDVDMMLPGVKARMSLLDSGKTVSGLSMAVYKIAIIVSVVAMAGVAGLIGAIVFIPGAVAYCLRSVFGYFHTRNKYELSLTRSLYFQNLDNSSGVLLRLTDEAEQQDFHEAVLAYFLLWKDGASAGLDAKEVDRRAESLLAQMCGCGIDFEVEDALKKLHRLGVAYSTADGRWRAVPLSDAIAALDRAWDSYFATE